MTGASCTSSSGGYEFMAVSLLASPSLTASSVDELELDAVDDGDEVDGT